MREVLRGYNSQIEVPLFPEVADSAPVVAEIRRSRKWQPGDEMREVLRELGVRPHPLRAFTDRVHQTAFQVATHPAVIRLVSAFAG